jgi:hypothetical protein
MASPVRPLFSPRFVPASSLVLHPFPPAWTQTSANAVDHAVTASLLLHQPTKRQRLDVPAGSVHVQTSTGGSACPVCLDPMPATTDPTNVATLSCDHALHTSCLVRMGAAGVHVRCPVCRAEPPETITVPTGPTVRAVSNPMKTLFRSAPVSAKANGKNVRKK